VNDSGDYTYVDNASPTSITQYAIEGSDCTERTPQSLTTSWAWVTSGVSPVGTFTYGSVLGYPLAAYDSDVNLATASSNICWIDGINGPTGKAATDEIRNVSGEWVFHVTGVKNFQAYATCTPIAQW
jgi:hypothetical protein